MPLPGKVQRSDHDPFDITLEEGRRILQAQSEAARRSAKMEDTPGIREAHEESPTPTELTLNDVLADVKRGPSGGGPPAEDFWGEMRTAAAAMEAIEYDSPERQAFFAAKGLPPTTARLRVLPMLAEGVYAQIDKENASESFAWAKWDLDRIKQGAAPTPGLNTVRLSSVMAVAVAWLWLFRIALGKITFIIGDPGCGKTWITLDICARVTTGRGFPDGTPNPFGDRRHVLWISAEDDDADTIKPRFLTLGGDPSRFHSLRSVTSQRGNQTSFNLRDNLDKLDDYLTRNPLIAVVVIDPVTAHLGNVDSHKNADVRSLLGPLAELAARHVVSILGINHMSKGDGSNAAYRSMGSIAFVAASRASWMVSRDPRDKDRRLLTPIKNNLAAGDVGGLAFRIGPDGLSWEEVKVDMTADEALRAVARATAAPARTDAKEWLRDQLSQNGPMLADDVMTLAKENDIAERTLLAAKKELGVRAKKTGGTGAPWEWSLPAK